MLFEIITYDNVGLLVLVKGPRLRICPVDLLGPVASITGLQPLIQLTTWVAPAQFVGQTNSRVYYPSVLATLNTVAYNPVRISYKQ